MEKPYYVGRRSLIASAVGLGCLVSSRVGKTASSHRRPIFGVNCYDLFLDGLNPGGTFGTAKIEALAKLNIQFIRFPVSPQWAAGWATYDRGPDRYWSGLETVFAAAEHSGIRLVPCVFWNPPALAFHEGDPIGAWGDPDSRTRAFASKFTAEITQRFDGSPALLIWEFANELNDWIDLPTVLKYWPKQDPTMPKRLLSQKDKLHRSGLIDMAKSFAETVRKQSSKLLSPGWNTPRYNAWNLAHDRWDADSIDQFKLNLRQITPAQYDVLSIHLYPDISKKRKLIFDSDYSLLSAFTETAAKDGRKSFVGEFGVPKRDDRAAERREFSSMMDALANSAIDYGAIWDYGRRVVDPVWNISPDNDRAYQLDALSSASRY